MNKSTLNLNLTPEAQDQFEIRGPELAVVYKPANEVYLSTKKYFDKLFKAAGYRSLSTIKILEEFAGMTIDTVGDISPYSIYIDNIINTFVVSSPDGINWMKAMFKFINENKFEVKSYSRYTPVHIDDQIHISNSLGGDYMIYPDLCTESVEVYSITFSDEGIITGVGFEGEFKFKNGQSSFDDFKLTISRGPNRIDQFDLSCPLSVREYLDLFNYLGYLKVVRGEIKLTEIFEDALDYDERLPDIVDQYSMYNPIQRTVKRTNPSRTFKDGCSIITEAVKSEAVPLREFYSYYETNMNNQNDIKLFEEGNRY